MLRPLCAGLSYVSATAGLFPLLPPPPPPPAPVRNKALTMCYENRTDSVIDSCTCTCSDIYDVSLSSDIFELTNPEPLDDQLTGHICTQT